MKERDSEIELPGIPLVYRGQQYGLKDHLKEYDNGDNLLRTDRLAQPRALKPGDILATGDEVLSESREGYNGSVFINITGGFDGHWIQVPARIPIALLTPEDNAPEELWQYHEKRKPRSKSEEVEAIEKAVDEGAKIRREGNETYKSPRDISGEDLKTTVS